MQNEKLSFTELAILAMQMVNRPITPSELWEFVLKNQLHHRLKTYDEQTQTFSGKTPKDTFHSQISTDKTHFDEIPSSNPKQYLLKPSFRQPERLNIESSRPKKYAYHERNLHAVLSYFLQQSDYLQA